MTERNSGTLAGGLGCFPLDHEAYPSWTDSQDNRNGIRSLVTLGRMVSPHASSVALPPLRSGFGGACAVALLAKTEAIILIAVLAASIALFQFPAAWRQPWPRTALWLGCFVFALAVLFLQLYVDLIVNPLETP